MMESKMSMVEIVKKFIYFFVSLFSSCLVSISFFFYSGCKCVM